jgi:hypothetical protein
MCVCMCVNQSSKQREQPQCVCVCVCMCVDMEILKPTNQPITQSIQSTPTNQLIHQVLINMGRGPLVVEEDLIKVRTMSHKHKTRRAFRCSYVYAPSFLHPRVMTAQRTTPTAPPPPKNNTHPNNPPTHPRTTPTHPPTHTTQALQDGSRLKGAALDVFDTEPLPPEHPYWKMENLLLSPHNMVGRGWCVTTARPRSCGHKRHTQPAQSTNQPNMNDKSKDQDPTFPFESVTHTHTHTHTKQ